MRSLRSIYFWTIGLGYFIPVLIILIIRSLIQAPEKYDPWLRRSVKTLFKLVQSQPLVEFAEELPTDRPLIFMANHSSLIDIPLLKAWIPEYFVGILADPQFKYPIYGSAVRRMGSIPIDRQNIRKSLRAFKRAEKLLSQGIHITVLPEGGRSLDGKLLPFKKLPFHFAKESGADIVPIAISGVYKMKNKGSFHLNPGRLFVRFAPVIPAEQIASLETEALMELTRKLMHDRLEPEEADIL